MYIGIDLGGTNIAAGITDRRGMLLQKKSVPTGKERPTDEIVRDMAQLVYSLVSEAGIDINRIDSVGVGCPGTIDRECGTVVYSNNIPMENYPLSAKLNELLSLPVFIDNDANCAALGEYLITGNNIKSFVLITLGTGIGGGVVIDGKIYHGFNGAAAEPGHITLVSGGELCTCGKRGCWEAYASGTALINQTKAAMENHPESLMHEIAENNGRITGHTAYIAAEMGDTAAKAVTENYARYVADGIVSVENMLQPEMIAIGGGISNEGAALFEPVIKYVSKNGFNKYLPKTEIVQARLGNDAGIIGAALLAV